ncbi:hypothetical protein [Victivallis sp. Marseille-Q1083]|uniref:hypothetical protein n=1 Tax=Victivallis sp. Marseille-Q1083 TaxID=2717288 RepID=UPI00158F3B49|nr:hypothetical protein [Victivallis sp. Marseille-Q1083]
MKPLRRFAIFLGLPLLFCLSGCASKIQPIDDFFLASNAAVKRFQPQPLPEPNPDGIELELLATLPSVPQFKQNSQEPLPIEVFSRDDRFLPTLNKPIGPFAARRLYQCDLAQSIMNYLQERDGKSYRIKTEVPAGNRQVSYEIMPSVIPAASGSFYQGLSIVTAYQLDSNPFDLILEPADGSVPADEVRISRIVCRITPSLSEVRLVRRRRGSLQIVSLQLLYQLQQVITSDQINFIVTQPFGVELEYAYPAEPTATP